MGESIRFKTQKKMTSSENKELEKLMKRIELRVGTRSAQDCSKAVQDTLTRSQVILGVALFIMASTFLFTALLIYCIHKKVKMMLERAKQKQCSSRRSSSVKTKRSRIKHSTDFSD